MNGVHIVRESVIASISHYIGLVSLISARRNYMQLTYLPTYIYFAQAVQQNKKNRKIILNTKK